MDLSRSCSLLIHTEQSAKYCSIFNDDPTVIQNDAITYRWYYERPPPSPVPDHIPLYLKGNCRLRGIWGLPVDFSERRLISRGGRAPRSKFEHAKGWRAGTDVCDGQPSHELSPSEFSSLANNVSTPSFVL
ncbi:hypothetical protein TNCT_282611 [Trichonephila clavata]|uniref:Uncharacterized protein n=1 Tax=Trichonephila clavata TaxID=2740835 RepID=A0A8X6KDS7_TRICU|nr:hypothetical protein TNCT_282611 [Trichonephila clavata]